MRIISGTARGAKLKTPRGLEIRPTSDRVKESVFNILGGFVIGAKVLDIFAGTGSLGLESLSRGAARATFIDHSPASIALIKQNALQTRLSERVEVYRSDVFRFLERLVVQREVFDLIFCDPPYNQGYVKRITDFVGKHCLLAPGGILVIEYSQHELPDMEALIGGFSCLSLWRTQRYGETRISFITMQSD